MSGALLLLGQLQAAAEPMLLCPHVAAPLRKAVAAATGTDDIAQALAGLVPVVLDAEASAAALTEHAKRLRATLAEVMDSAGATTIRSGQHVASVSAGRPGVVVTDPAAIPATLMRTPAPVPDKAAILAALKAGGEVPGAALSNGGPVLSIRSKA